MAVSKVNGWDLGVVESHTRLLQRILTIRAGTLFRCHVQRYRHICITCERPIAFALSSQFSALTSNVLKICAQDSPERLSHAEFNPEQSAAPVYHCLNKELVAVGAVEQRMSKQKELRLQYVVGRA
jgi:hypothetical protein